MLTGKEGSGSIRAELAEAEKDKIIASDAVLRKIFAVMGFVLRSDIKYHPEIQSLLGKTFLMSV